MHLFSSVLELLERAPDSTFCYFLANGDERRVTVHEVVRQAHAIGSKVQATLSRKPGFTERSVVVPILLEHRPEVYSAFIGVSLAGACPAFLPPLTQKQDPAVFRHSLGALLARIDPPCIVVSNATSATVEQAYISRINLDEPLAENQLTINEPAPDDIAFLQHSSGTTGLKKGVQLSHRTVLAQIKAYASAISLAKEDVIASWLPLYHDMGLITSFLMPAVFGVPIISIDTMEWVVRPTMLLDAIERFNATLCWLPNFAFHHITRLAEPTRQWRLDSLRAVVNCSEPCRSQAFDVFERRFATSGLRKDALQVSYAMAENVFAVTQTARGVQISKHARFPGFLSSGSPIAGVSLRIMSSENAPCADAEVGEIQISGPYLFSGYFKLPELSAECLRDGWYRTGDLGFLDGGALFVVGRIDDVLNVNGKKLVAHEIEDDLNYLGGLAPGRILVFAELDEASGASQLMVAAERSLDVQADDRSIAAEVRRRVLENCGLRPNRVFFVEKGFLLKSTSGKISRRASIEKLREHNRI